MSHAIEARSTSSGQAQQPARGNPELAAPEPGEDNLSISGELLDGLEIADNPATGPEQATGNQSAALVRPTEPVIDDEQLMTLLYAKLATEMDANKVLAEAQMERVIRASVGIERSFLEGVGQTMATIPPLVYSFWCAKLGPGCWKDGTLVTYLAKRYPGFALKSKGKTCVIVEKSFKRGRWQEAKTTSRRAKLAAA